MTDELLSQFGQHIAALTLIPSSGGRFEVKVDDRLIFSKAELGRHAEAGEVVRLFEAQTGFAPQSA